ncbi:hypothetical protein Trco_003989 [Trichoderma cornu-damae]|uniref:Uncharacterized protein n=1 Tax=Trichoderma cornu-damae TaxID=654480 RepID=A0A9P8QJU5_9HYPO|nr:hypothetical protein Trco_003989 [Trichoderma cornu-damae]
MISFLGQFSPLVESGPGSSTMGLFKGRTGAGATMHNPNFSEYELGRGSTPAYAALEQGPQKWAGDGDYKYSREPRSSSRSARAVATESAASPFQNHSPYLSPGLDANTAAGRLRQVDQLGFSRSTDQISLDLKATSSAGRSASTKPWEARSYKQYHIPIRSEILSPASNPKGAPASSLPIPSFTNGHETPATIGMALGSPSHYPGSGSVQPLWQAQVLTTVTSEGHASEQNPNANGLSRSMSKRWNPFNRTKSKRSKPAENPPSRAPGTDPGKSVDLGGRFNGAKNADASWAGKKKAEREADKKGAGSAALKDGSGSLSRSPIGDVPALPNLRDPAAPTRTPPVPPQFQQLPPKQLQSLLNVEIPTIEMERYSIMFGNILQQQQQQQQLQYFLQQAQQAQQHQPSQGLQLPSQQPQQADKSRESQGKPEEQPLKSRPFGNPQQSREPEKPRPEDILQPQPRPTLPVRRQVKLDRLELSAAKDFRDGSVPFEIVVPRRSTSPLPKGSPSFSLFPQEPAPANSLPPRLSSRTRSNTSPAVVNFPAPAVFKAPAEARKRTTSVSTPSHDEPLPADVQTTPERRERLVSKFHRKESPPDLNMPKTTDQMSESPAAASAPPPPRSILKKPTGPPPPPPPNRKAEPMPSSQQMAPPKQHQHQLSKASVRSETDEEVEKALYEAVEISIARQISVSRQQRRMLVPLNRSASRRAPSETAADAAAQISPTGQNKRLAETRTATPVLVHPAKETNQEQGGYRKSSRAVLEGARRNDLERCD